MYLCKSFKKDKIIIIVVVPYFYVSYLTEHEYLWRFKANQKYIAKLETVLTLKLMNHIEK